MNEQKKKIGWVHPLRITLEIEFGVYVYRCVIDGKLNFWMCVQALFWENLSLLYDGTEGNWVYGNFFLGNI